jgi:hypothetical protein
MPVLYESVRGRDTSRNGRKLEVDIGPVLTFATPAARIQSKANRDSIQAMMARITKKKTIPSPASWKNVNAFIFDAIRCYEGRLTEWYESMAYVTRILLTTDKPKACIPYPNASPIHLVLCSAQRPKITSPMGPMTQGIIRVGRRYSGSRRPPFFFVMRFAIISIILPPIKIAISVPIKPERASLPRLEVFQR